MIVGEFGTGKLIHRTVSGRLTTTDQHSRRPTGAGLTRLKMNEEEDEEDDDDDE
jgi:hypothetical protein